MPSFVTRNLYYALFVLSGLGAFYGFWNWRLEPLLVGMVETCLHPVAPRVDGRVTEVLVRLGDRVEPGQILVRLDNAELLAERERLHRRENALVDLLKADRRRHAEEYDLLRLRIAQQDATGRAEQAELAAIERAIDRLARAQTAGLGRDPELVRLQIRRDALRSTVSGRISVPSAPTATAAGRDTVLQSLLGDRADRLHQTRLRLAQIDIRLKDYTLRAPAAGWVVQSDARAGAAVEAYRTLLSIEDPRVRYAAAYLPEAQDRPISAGNSVEIHSRRAKRFDAAGRVSFVHPGFAPVPQRLWLNGRAIWARKLRIELEDGHGLLPGEAVQVRLLPEGN